MKIPAHRNLCNYFRIYLYDYTYVIVIYDILIYYSYAYYMTAYRYYMIIAGLVAREWKRQYVEVISTSRE